MRNQALARERQRDRPTPPALSEYLTRHDCADDLGITCTTLDAWRSSGSGPPFTKIGGRYFYRRAALAEWIASRETRPAA